MKGKTYEALTSIYREALNTESPFYQFLCFCRVVQRLQGEAAATVARRS